MSADWRLYVYEPDGTALGFVDPTDGIVLEIPRIGVAPSGNSLEMEFTAIPTNFDGQARYLVVFQISVDGGSTYTSLFRGIITAAGDPRADTVRTYRAVGLYKRFSEVTVTEFRIEEDDVAAQALVLANGGTFLPDGMSTAVAADFPDTNFTGGDRFPGFETVADGLNALAETVGEFVVPTGETYTYDGVTYSAGDVVPPVRWGVLAETGTIFFRRPQAAAVAFDEGTRRTEVKWTRVNAEETIDYVRLSYAGTRPIPEVSAGACTDYPNTQEPVTRLFGSGAYEAERLVEIDFPKDFMVSIDWEADWTVSAGAMTNLSNAFDGNDGTYAYNNSATDAEIRILGQTAKSSVLRVRGAVGANALSPSGNAMYVTVDWNKTGFSTNKRRAWYIPPISSGVVGDPFEIWTNLDVPVCADAGVNEFKVFIGLAEDSRVFSVEWLEPDVDSGGTASERLAEGYMRSPAAQAAEVRYRGFGAISQTLDLTGSDGTAYPGLPIERIEYSVTVEGGVETTYFIGEAFDADLEAEKVLIGEVAKAAINR